MKRFLSKILTSAGKMALTTKSFPQFRIEEAKRFPQRILTGARMTEKYKDEKEDT